MTHLCMCNRTKKCVNHHDVGLYEYSKYPGIDVYKEIFEMEFEDYQNFLPELDSFRFYCRHISHDDGICDSSFFRLVQCPSEWPYPSACYTVSPSTNSSHPLYFKKDMHLIVVLYGRKFDETHPHELSNFLVTVHNTRQVVNPFDTGGQDLRLGDYNDYYLTKIVKKLLPYPYETNCTDYIKLWTTRGYTGPLNEKECHLECQKNVSMQYFGCISHEIMIPGRERRCHKYLPLKAKEDIGKCQNDLCGPACYEEEYIANKQFENIPHDLCNGIRHTSQFMQGTMVSMLLSGDIITYEYTAAFESIEVLSYVGGYLGVWLGISIVAVFDFLETLFSVSASHLKRRLKRRNAVFAI